MLMVIKPSAIILSLKICYMSLCLSVVVLSAIMLSVNMLCVIKLCVCKLISVTRKLNKISPNVWKKWPKIPKYLHQSLI